MLGVHMGRRLNRQISEIEYAADAGVNKQGGNPLGLGGGDGQDSQADLLLLNDLSQAIERVAPATMNHVVYFLGVVVEGGDKIQRRGPGREMRQDGASETTQADNGDVLRLRAIQQLGDTIDELTDIIAMAGTAGITQGHEVTPNLGGAHPTAPAKLAGINLVRTLNEQVL